MIKFMNNKKILILIVLSLLLLIVGGIYFGIQYLNNDLPGENPDEIVSETDEYIRDDEGNVKKVLIIDNNLYRMEMDLLGTWKEYLLPVEKRDLYQAFLIPNKTKDTIPYFYISIKESDVVNNKEVVEEEIVYDLRKEYESFELQQVIKKNVDDRIKYVVSYTTVKGKEEMKNYQTIFYQDGYKVSLIYSANSLDFASEKGYIDDMIDTVVLNVKK